MTRRKITALALLERIKRQALEEEAGAHARLRRRIAALDAEREALLAGLRAHGKARTLETARFLPTYIRSVRAEEARLLADRAALEAEAAALEERVRERFRDLKTHEAARDTAIAEDSAARARRESAEIDERTLQRWQANAARLHGD